ncbi:hypothetical protein [Piscirickettsia litoralis]|uniref:Uncharacterized protein n=1 Tax=Piscirickettsia litoralis TaxID=1891921 RepID=A0ABX3A440_9GAMM|nr:hypothetical protein [Piscirickettsia litoralis]ODN42205.1 hypothetical protein BGC07_03720 [Piscirickettsia litoralis]
MPKKLELTMVATGVLFSLISVANIKSLTEAEFKATKLPYSVMAYSNKYAHEYGLDASKAIKLPKGLEAIRLTLYKKHYPKGGGMLAFDVYKCSAELYVDKGLDIWWPTNQSKTSNVETGQTGLKAFFCI